VTRASVPLSILSLALSLNGSVEGVDVVLHLAGEPIVRFPFIWTKSKRRRIEDSRNQHPVRTMTLARPALVQVYNPHL